jgi:CBS-domain-containing membrane protein
MFLNLHPKVSAPALVVVLTALVAFVTNSFGFTPTIPETVLITGAISGLVGYLVKTGTWVSSS